MVCAPKGFGRGGGGGEHNDLTLYMQELLLWRSNTVASPSEDAA
jgi:hypothetical protein